MQLTAEHRAIDDTVTKFVEKELNPHEPVWVVVEQFQAHEVY